MNSRDTHEAVVCSTCGRPSPAGALCCDRCGKDLAEDRTIRDTTPYNGPFPPALVSADTGPVLLAEHASPAALHRLRDVLDEVIGKGFNHFPGEVLWPEEGGQLRQTVPPGSISLARLLEEVPPSRQGWQLPLIEEMARAVDDLHQAGGVLRGIRPESVLINCQTLGFAGFCVPLCLGRSSEEQADLPVEGLENCFAAPEVLDEVEAPVGPQADVYLVATLAADLLSGGRANETGATGPAVSAVLEEATALFPALRPATASGLAAQLRRALVRDTAVGGWDFQSSAFSHIGLGGRSNNEDAWGTWARAEGRLGTAGSVAVFVVADGMGGEAHGERASNRAIAGVLEEAEEYLPHLGGALSVPAALASTGREWILGLNEEVLALGRRLGAEGRMGTTLTGLFFVGRRALLFHVGDSRAYLLRGDVLAQLTRDQTFAQQLRDQGLLSSEQESAGVYKNVLVSHLGSPHCQPQVETLAIAPGDRILLCSDGLIEGLDEEVLAEVLASSPLPVAARALVEESQRRLNVLRRTSSGGDGRLKSDNMTAVVVEVLLPGGLGDEPLPAPPTIELTPH